jgi:antitoxin YefM
MAKVVSYTELRSNLAAVMDEVCDSAAPVVVTRQGARPVVMRSLAGRESSEETLHLLSTRANAERLLRAIARAEAGEGRARTVVEPADEPLLPAEPT